MSFAIVGHGVELIPRLPVGVAHLRDGTLIFGDLLVAPAEPPARAAIVPGAGVDPGALFEAVREVEPGGRWAIVSGGYRMDWPPTFTLRADHDPVTPYEFGLDGSAEDLILPVRAFDGPAIPAPERLVAPGQTLEDEGRVPGVVGDVVWIELAYPHDGAAWMQRFYYVPISATAIFLLRLQAREALADAVVDGGDLVASSFRPV